MTFLWARYRFSRAGLAVIGPVVVRSAEMNSLALCARPARSLTGCSSARILDRHPSVKPTVCDMMARQGTLWIPVVLGG